MRILCQRLLLSIACASALIAQERARDWGIPFSGTPGPLNAITQVKFFPNDGLNPFFTAVADATEEAILNAMVAARDMTGFRGNTARALPKQEVQEMLKRHGRLGK